MRTVVFDCEYLVDEGAFQRFWCGPNDPDPVAVQIGAVAFDPANPDVTEHFSCLIRPRDRHGKTFAIAPLLTRLTGIAAEAVATEGLPLAQALAKLDAFSKGARFYSWGKDELNLIAISCYVEGIAPPIPASRFANACQLVEKAGVPLEDIHKTRSNTLCALLGVDDSDLRGHDALDDARAVARALRHLLQERRLQAADFA